MEWACIWNVVWRGGGAAMRRHHRTIWPPLAGKAKVKGLAQEHSNRRMEQGLKTATHQLQDKFLPTVAPYKITYEI